MKEFNVHFNNRMAAFMTIAILAVGSISIMGTTHVVMADQNGKVCIIVACDSSANLGSGSNNGGNSNDGSKGTLTVKKQVDCITGVNCAAADTFTIKVTGTDPLPDSFQGSTTGTEVKLSPGDYKVSENPVAGFDTSFSGDCDSSISAGDTKECTVINTLKPQG